MYSNNDICILGEQCRICLSQYQMNDEALTMPCNHIFHESCLKTWLEKVMNFFLLLFYTINLLILSFQSNFCPLCKFELKTDNEMYELYKEELKNRQTRENNIAQLHNSMFS